MRRVDVAMREVLGEAISTDLSDPRLGFVTVTGVKTSPDLRHARVYVSVLGTYEERAATLEALQSARGFLQSRVAQALRIKHTPSLVFDYDESIDRGMRMSELIEKTVGGHGPDRGDAE
jgi:ribosome-binding factor A